MVADLVQCVTKTTPGGGQLAVPKMAIRGIGWLAYCKDTEGNLFGMLEADADVK